MSVGSTGTAAPRASAQPAGWVALAVAALGAAALAGRALLLPAPAELRLWTFAGVLGGIGVASWLASEAGPQLRRLPRRGALAVGFGAVLTAVAVVGRPPGVPFGTAAVPLAMLAAVAEELLFRQLAYGAIARRSEPLAVAVTAVAFALVHLPLYGTAALPLDLGAGLLFSWQRWASGTWTVPAATHAAANLLAVLR